MQQCSKLRILMAGIVYKAKRSVTTFLLRIFIKRVLARIAVKTFLPFVGVLINAVWNGSIGYKVMRGARVISIGPSIAIKTFDVLLAQRRGESYKNIPDHVKELCVRAIASVVVVKEMWHPNLYVLLRHAKFRLKITNNRIRKVSDFTLLLDGLKDTMISDRRFVLRVLTIACVLDGYLIGEITELFNQACVVADLAVKDNALEDLRSLLIRSHLTVQDVLDVFSEDVIEEWREQSACQKCRRCDCTSCVDKTILCFAC